jgi:choline dehydrogenase-like flavoprotein
MADDLHDCDAESTVKSVGARSAAGAVQHFDAVVVGTGFAGAVTACRLVEAGFAVCVFERGRRYGKDDFPRFPTDELFASAGQRGESFAPPPDFSRWLWKSDRGLYDFRDLEGAMALQAAGYGGGSLIYANVHMRPPYDVFDDRWPTQYRGDALGPYFDLAAYMLGARPIPQRLAKTVQLQRAAEVSGTPASWFRTPLAVNFDIDGENAFQREQQPCDMRGRCWRGCDRQAKNTLDSNYLARAEDSGCDIRTMAEVKIIRREGGKFLVCYDDLLRREQLDPVTARVGDNRPRVSADYVFLCAGAVNTTQLLFENKELLSESARRALGSHYFPNADSLAVVFECDEAHEPDYGPTITSALLYNQPANDEFSVSLEFAQGQAADGPPEADRSGDATGSPTAGTVVQSSSGGVATLSHDPIPDRGCWQAHDAAGSLALVRKAGEFKKDDTLWFDNNAKAVARSAAVDRPHWFLVEDGGYPPDLEQLIGVFRSPLWLRRNRYREGGTKLPEDVAERRANVESSPLRRPPAGRLRVEAFGGALGATSGNAFAAEGFTAGALSPGPSGADFELPGPRLLLPDLLGEQLQTIFPAWFVKALADDRNELLRQAAALALPMLGRLLDEMSETVAAQIDPETRARLSKEKVERRQLEVLVRGLLRQVLQILAGSEAAVATKAAEALLNPVPGTPAQLVDLLAGIVLWAIGYDTTEGHAAVLLTMGRDSYRGRLTYEPKAEVPLRAALPSRVLDTASATHERVLREIAGKAWRGELRTNPGWTTLAKRVTVHSQGGCPMREDGEGVTAACGQVDGCARLYVMDAAAFPTSVGVNPSATIAAIAEYKVEKFIQRTRKDWKAADHENARHWMTKYGRAALDPLNHGDVQTRPQPAEDVDVLGLRFMEEMMGFFKPVAGLQTNPLIRLDDLRTFPEVISEFLSSEGDGITMGRAVHVALKVTAPDLARLVSSQLSVLPASLNVEGCWAQAFTNGDESAGPERPSPDRQQGFVVEDRSFLRMFARSQGQDERRFFCYQLRFVRDGQPWVMNGLKVLRDAPGFDSWHDTSTVYYEAGPAREDGELKVVEERGILRVPVDIFLRVQLPSMDITGTDDPARKSWALLAFYKYFAAQLADIYMKRADALRDALFKLVTEIHV